MDSFGRYDDVYSDCECGLDCYCLYSEICYNSYIYRCMLVWVVWMSVWNWLWNVFLICVYDVG